MRESAAAAIVGTRDNKLRTADAGLLPAISAPPVQAAPTMKSRRFILCVCDPRLCRDIASVRSL
jgi:hypothetical protein